MDFDGTPASAITSASPGAPLAPPQPKKSRKRRRRRNHRSANQNSAPRSAAPLTPDERWANKNLASQSATQPKSAANDLPKMMSTPVYQHPSFYSSHLPQPPFPAANGNSAFQFGLDHCRIPGLYKPAHPDPRQDLTATLTRENISGSGFSSPSLLQPCSYYFGHCSDELAACIPPPLARPRSTRQATFAHNYCVELSNARINRFSDGFFPSTSHLWNSLPSAVFPASFNLPSFKRQVYHHLRDQMA